MYEHITQEQVLKDMTAHALDYDSKLDSREGSVLWYGLAPVSVEFINMLTYIDAVYRNTFADTAGREYLILRARERGLAPYAANAAILRCEITPIALDLPIGSRFSGDDLNYIITEKIEDGAYMARCETVGAAGNDYLGRLIPIEYIGGMQTAELTEILIPGEDDEDTEAFRKRYFASFNAQAFGGNIADYKEKVNAMDGVGGVKAYPVWNGGGTVKLIIIDATYGVPSDTLLEAVQTSVDPVPNNAEGVGTAPIGHYVTVEGVQADMIDISLNITYAEGWMSDTAREYIEAAIDEYFAELAQGWATSEVTPLDSTRYLTVRVSQLESRLLTLEAVEDIADTVINGAAENYVLAPECIPVRGEISG